jgi:DeoR family ulaG and ulaABCDEF operon transcriptional repressor
MSPWNSFNSKTNRNHKQDTMSLNDVATKMHAAERDKLILGLLEEKGFLSCRELSRRLPTSPATLRRDLDRLQIDGKVMRVHGGVRPSGNKHALNRGMLRGAPFDKNINRNRLQKQAIGRAAAKLCRPGEAIILDGGSTTLNMCPYLEPLKLQVLTNSLHIVSALLPQPHTSVSITGGTVFREQNIVIDANGTTKHGTFRASQMFCSAASVTRHGLMQTDIILVQAELKLREQADELIALVDSSKFAGLAGHVLCELSQVKRLITDSGIDGMSLRMLESEGVEVIVAATEP